MTAHDADELTLAQAAAIARKAGEEAQRLRQESRAVEAAHDTDELTLETMTDTPTREEVEAMVKRERPFQCPECKSTLRVGYDLIHQVDCTARGDLARLAAACLALLDRHEEAVGVIREAAEPVALGVSYRREWDKRIARAREFLRKNGVNG